MIHALHGFLGRPKDWEILDGQLPYISHDLFGGKIGDFDEWAKEFNRKISASDHPILMGYSLGGRLALHALIQDPSLWSAAVIISAHPGLTSAEEKKQRLQQDQEWANRFLEDAWEQLMEDWNAQAVFQSPLKRNEKDYCRETLSQAMLQWSLGRQRDLRPELAKLNIPIVWVVGEKDTKFRTLASSVTLSHPKSRISIIPKAGHRVPWEQPEACLSQILSIVKKEG